MSKPVLAVPASLGAIGRRSMLAVAILGLTVACAPQANAAKDKPGAMMPGMMQMGRYGGPVYTGDPALGVTASLVAAGGGAANYSTAAALTSIAGADTINGEVAKLNKQYGAKRVTRFLLVFDYAVTDALAIATKAGVVLPAPTLTGKELGTTLVTAGQDTDGTFYTGFLLDKAVTHNIHMQVMDDIDKKFGAKSDKDYHRISNQAHYDLGTALGVPNLKLAELH